MSSLLVSEVAGVQTSKYANFGGLAILIFDYCITFQDEVQWSWSKPWNLTRVIFTISRYLPFISTGMIAYIAVLRVSNSSLTSIALGVIHILSIVAAEGLLLLRTWAFWKRSRRLLIGLLSYCLLIIIAVLALNYSPKQLIPGDEPTPGYFESSRNFVVEYIFLATYEIAILILTAYKRFRDYANIQNSIVENIYRDGMLYMLCIIGITISNIILGVAFPIAYSNIFDTLQLVIHSVLASRILFRLRSIDYQAYEMPMNVFSESIHFAVQSSNVGSTGSRNEV